MGFSSVELKQFENQTVPDLIGGGCRLLFVGINPGLWTAATQTHFCHPSNRFYPALRLAGLIDFTVEADEGMTEEQRREFVASGLGITNLVARATARAAVLTRDELASGGARLVRLVSELKPATVAIAGVTAYRGAFGDPHAALGRQPDGLADAELWVVPNPSGLNAHETVSSLAEWFGRAAVAAGVA